MRLAHHDQPAAAQLLDVVDRRQCLLEVPQRPACGSQKRLARSRQTRAAAYSVEQLHAELTFKVLNREAERWLRDVQRGGRIRERAVIRYGEEVLKAASVYRASLSHPSQAGL
jgi:hypothetical protein